MEQTKKNRQIILAILGVVIIILSIIGFGRLQNSKKSPVSVNKEIVTTAFTQEVSNSTIPVTINSNGTVTATDRIDIFSEVQGIFTSSSQPFKEGTTFGKYQTLIQLDGAEFYSSIVAQRSTFYNQVVGVMPDLKLDYPASFNKWNSYLNSIDVNKSLPALPNFDSDQEKFLISGRNVVSTFHSIKNLEARYTKYRIGAPFSGILVEANVAKGALISPGQKLGTFINPSKYEVKVSIAERYKQYLAQGKEVTLSSLDGKEEYTGKVIRLNSQVDPASQTIDAFIQVSGKDLYEGKYLQVMLDAEPIKNAIEIERKLLVENSKVFAIEDSSLVFIDVNPVYFTEETAIITGLENGLILLEKPIPGAYPGMKVAINE